MKCFVLQCNNNNSTMLSGNAFSYHMFPKDEKIRREWLIAIGRDGCDVTHHRVCSHHFAKNDYDLNQKKRILKIGAIPSRNLPNIKPDAFSEFLEEFNKNFEDIPSAMGLSRKSPTFQEEEVYVPRISSLKHKRFPKDEKIRSQWSMANDSNGSYQRVCSNPFAKNKYDLNQKKWTGERIQKIGAIPSKNVPNPKPEDDFSDFLEEFNENFEDIPNALGLLRKSPAFQEEEINVLRTSSLKNERFPKDEKIRSKRLPNGKMANGRHASSVSHQRVYSNPYAKKYLTKKNRAGERIRKIGEIPSRNLPNIKPDAFSELLEEFNQTFEDIPHALGLLRKTPAFQEKELNVPRPRTSSLKHKRNGRIRTSMDLQEEATSYNTNIKGLINPNEIETETIIIEVTADKEGEEDDSISDNVENLFVEVTLEEETTIDQLPDPTPPAITINCKNQGCNFKCKDVNLILEHSKMCRHKSAQKHKTKIKRNVPWYKCCLCNSIIKHRSLDTHTKFHAREKGDLFLKVEFKKYFKGKFLGYKTNTAEPFYKHNITNGYYNNAIRNKPGRRHLPELDYNPDEPVFECDECNFKTNESGDLEKHRKLHWNAQKNEMYKTNKRF